MKDSTFNSLIDANTPSFIEFALAMTVLIAIYFAIKNVFYPFDLVEYRKKPTRQIIEQIATKIIVSLMSMWLLWGFFVKGCTTGIKKEMEKVEQSFSQQKGLTVRFIPSPDDNELLIPTANNGKPVNLPDDIKLPPEIKKNRIEGRAPSRCFFSHPFNNELYERCLTGYWEYRLRAIVPKSTTEPPVTAPATQLR